MYKIHNLIKSMSIKIKWKEWKWQTKPGFSKNSANARYFQVSVTHLSILSGMHTKKVAKHLKLTISHILPEI